MPNRERKALHGNENPIASTPTHASRVPNSTPDKGVKSHAIVEIVYDVCPNDAEFVVECASIALFE